MKLTTILTSIFFLGVCSGQSNRDKAISETLKARRLPGTDVCGLSKVSLDNKIIGGEAPEPGSYPWMANIGYTKKGSSEPVRWRCGGSLITDQYVITAAHCLHPDLLRERLDWIRWEVLEVKAVRLGEVDLNPDVDDGASPVDFDIEKIIYHQEFNNTIKVNDIGLIKLTRKVHFSDMIGPICLPHADFDNTYFVGNSATVAGWGKSVTSGKSGTQLLEAELKINDLEGCKKNLTSVRGSEKLVIDERVICASAPGKSACQGDSGGPVMFFHKLKTSSGNMFLMGIVSYGYGCALEGYPGVSTRVSKHMAWIINNLDI